MSLWPDLRRYGIAASIFFVAFVVYQLNGTTLAREGDSSINAALPLTILARGALTVRPAEVPWLFEWQLDGAEEPVKVLTPSQLVAGESVADLVSAGRLRAVRATHYSLVPTRRPG